MSVTPYSRAASVAILGLAVAWLALRHLDIDIDRNFLSRFLLLPLGVLCVVVGIASALWTFIRD